MDVPLAILFQALAQVMCSIQFKFQNTVPAQIERRRSNFRLGFFGEDFTK